MAKLIIVTRHWGGLGLAMLAQRQGSDVVCAFDYGGLRGTELENTTKIGDGLVKKLSLHQAIANFTREGALWVFDGNDLPREADALKEDGETVLGTTALSKRLEDDRQFAADTAKQVGFALPETEEFTNYEEAIKFLDENEDRAFVYKPDKQDPTATYVPLEKDDPEQANQELQQYLQSMTQSDQTKFVIQERKDGVEANFELWLHRGRPVAGFLDLESKRRLNDDLGENIGCAGDYVLRVPVDSPSILATVGKYLRWDQLAEYTGTIDANVILADDQAFFLENCFRFGYNAYPTIFQAVAIAPVETILRAWVEGEDTTQYFGDGIGGSLSLVVTSPKLGSPIIVPPELEADTYLYRAYKDDKGLHMVEKWSELACVTATGSTIPEAGALCLDRAEQVSMPGKGYRTDLGEDTMETLPEARYQALQSMGLIGERTEMSVWEDA